jgi:hypothetical protein
MRLLRKIWCHFCKKTQARVVLTVVVEAIARIQGGRNRGEGPIPYPQILADQLTLFQPGGQIMPTTLLLDPPQILANQLTLFHLGGGGEGRLCPLNYYLSPSPLDFQTFLWLYSTHTLL